MAFRVRELDAERKFCDQLTMAALQQVLPMATVEAVLHQHGALTPRHRKLSLPVVAWVVIAMHLYTHVAIGDLLAQLAHGLRFLWPDLPDGFPTPGAFTYRRYQLGARPLAALFHHLCRPIATPDTQGAFLFGLRLMAIDGTVENLPDTPHNMAVFGRPGTDRGAGAFPQVQSVYLCECGTHAIVDAGFWPCPTSERIGAKRLLRSVGPGMLVMWDRGLHSYAMLAAARHRGAHVLARLPAKIRLAPVRRRPDGSWLCWLEERDDRGRPTGKRMHVRLIEYTLDDPGRPGHGEGHRLITTLLSWRRAPAHALVCAYHERWEIETTIDEQQVHQRLALRPLRSHKPVGVIQELYGLLIGHYLIRYLMHEAALSSGVDPDRISFVHALRVIGQAISDFEIASPELLPGLYARLLREIAAGRLPARRNRSNPRVVKRKMSNFALKRAEHRPWPRPTRTFPEAVRLI
jgi:Insertion element 4 transposase N-terminal/Transposase DDE domain